MEVTIQKGGLQSQWKMRAAPSRLSIDTRPVRQLYRKQDRPPGINPLELLGSSGASRPGTAPGASATARDDRSTSRDPVDARPSASARATAPLTTRSALIPGAGAGAVTQRSVSVRGSLSSVSSSGSGGPGALAAWSAAAAPTPQRVDVPARLGSPRRSSSSGGALGGSGSVSTTAMPELESEEPLAFPIRLLRQRSEVAAARSSVRDCAMLADACRRAGRSRLEGQSYYRLGVLHDNAGAFAQAVECYKKYLLTCRRTGDTEGEAVALNHLGVNYHLLGEYQRAIACHSRHRDVADASGKYVAHCNLGLVYAATGQHDRAAQNFRHALRYAVAQSNLQGEHFAYERLGLAGKDQGDSRFARACMERCLALATTMNDRAGRQAAYKRLGKLAMETGDLEEASNCLTASLEVAEQAGGGGKDAHQVRCQLGIALGEQGFEDFMEALSHKLQSHTPGKDL